MAGRPGAAPLASAGSGRADEPALMPSVLLRRGQLYLPGPKGPVLLRRADGPGPDVFDVVDRLAARYRRVYLVDLDGIERGQPQLEYLQEISREVDLWVDAGVPTAEAAIDILVAGAQRAVLSSAFLRSPVELRRAWRLTTDIAWEVEVQGSLATVASPAWESRAPVDVARAARKVGYTDVILAPRGQDPDWSMVAQLARDGPTWVAGGFERNDAARLRDSGAAGGIFHINDLVPELLPEPEPAPSPSSSAR